MCKKTCSYSSLGANKLATHLCSPYFFLEVLSSFSKISQNEMSLYSHYNTRLKFISHLHAESLSQQFRSYNYVFYTSGKKRKLGSVNLALTDSFSKHREFIVNESLYLILKFIFEPKFESWKQMDSSSHILTSCGYSIQEIIPNFCSHIYRRSTNYLGINGELPFIDPAICLLLLRRYIKDHKFLTLINNFLISSCSNIRINQVPFLDSSKKIVCCIYCTIFIILNLINFLFRFLVVMILNF
uniref:Uncharacterized protein n=1 Tax=Eutreptiella pomquetensis TaxID=215699 RepID=A0A223FM93_9EUGL|nr:hypothetical protein [Eutreptiella pomquetensis]